VFKQCDSKLYQRQERFSRYRHHERNSQNIHKSRAVAQDKKRDDLHSLLYMRYSLDD